MLVVAKTCSNVWTWSLTHAVNYVGFPTLSSSFYIHLTYLRSWTLVSISVNPISLFNVPITGQGDVGSSISLGCTHYWTRPCRIKHHSGMYPLLDKAMMDQASLWDVPITGQAYIGSSISLGCTH